MPSLQDELMNSLSSYETGRELEISRNEKGEAVIGPSQEALMRRTKLRAPMRQRKEEQTLEKTAKEFGPALAGTLTGPAVGAAEVVDLGLGLVKGAYKAAFPEADEGRFESFMQTLGDQFESGYGEGARSMILDIGRRAGYDEEQLKVMDEGITAGSFFGYGGAVKAAPKVASAIGDAVEGAGDAAKARMADADGSVTLTSGVDPDPAIAAAGDAVKSLRARKGQMVGAPKDITSSYKLNKLRREVEGLAIEGTDARFWYERSGKAILDAVGGDKEEAEKIIQIIAVTSPSTPVKSNFDYALQAYAQHKAGEPIMTGRFPTAMNKRIESILSGEEWEGRKTNNFYVNLMRVVDPQKVQGVTTDLWMMRSFGFDTDNPTDAQYSFVERETNRIASKLGWEPQQAQAAIWVAQKAKEEGKEISASKFDYSDALEQNLAQVSWESIPGRTSDHMLEMFDAPYEVQQEYHVEISKAFQDNDGFDLIARRLGIPTPGDFEAPGFFEGKVSPGTQTQVSAPRQYRGPKYGAVEQSALDLMEAYAAARGVLMKQDGVGYHRPFYSPAKKDGNGVEIRIGRPFSEAETKRFASLLNEKAGFEIAPIGSVDGVRIINFDPEFDNKEFQNIVKDATNNLVLDDDAELRAVLFASQNGYLGNDWSKFKNGEEYFSGISKEGRSDIYRKVQDIVKEIQPRIEAVDADFSEKYGFTRNEQINSAYRVVDQSQTPNAENLQGVD